VETVRIVNRSQRRPWLIDHPYHGMRGEEEMGKIVLRLAGAALIAVAVVGLVSLEQGERTLVGLVVGIPSFALMILSRRQLGNSFAVKPQATTLVTSGLYSRIQHPMYLFLDLFLASFIVVFGSPVLLWPWAVLVVLQVIQSRKEEKVLSDAFGETYFTYSRSTWL
jgi:protein-S-isoprenylcysteine O-methyltransferase Ste14